MLVGSVAGQRYWSTLLPAADTQEMITCGTWTPDDQQVYLGTSQVRIFHRILSLRHTNTYHININYMSIAYQLHIITFVFEIDELS